MYEHTDSSIEKRMVGAIRKGLYEAKEEKQRKTGIIDNAIHIEKSDSIANNLINEFHEDIDFKYVLCPRGRCTVLFLYDTVQKIIYSFFREHTFRELLKQRTINSSHYINTLLDFNPEFERIQMVIDEELFSRDNEYEVKVQELKAKIITMLKGEEPKKYTTICYSIDGFRLCMVKSIVTSKYLEIIDENDLSEYIGIDYNDAIFEDTPRNVLDDEVKVTLKPDLPNPPNNQNDFRIPVKGETDKQNNNKTES